MARGREAISARVIANLLECQGASRVIFFDIHNRAIQGFFNIPVDPLSAMPLLADYLALYPEAKLDFTLDDRNVDLVNEGYDLASRDTLVATSRSASSRARMDGGASGSRCPKLTRLCSACAARPTARVS